MIGASLQRYLSYPFLLTYLASHLGECDTVGANERSSGYANWVSFTNTREKYKPATTVMVEQNVVRIWEYMLLEDEVYLIRHDEDKKFSDFNNNFHNKVSTHNCVYERFETGKSQIDTWGILVDINKPTLLNIHGGPASQYGFGFFDEFQVFASSGFNVVACNPRGSSGRGHKFVRDVCGSKWGENDTYDVIKSFEMMIKKLGIKNKNYGIMGGSYGGFMTSWVISHYPKLFKSAVVERALLNWETMVGTSDIGIGFPEMYLLDDLKSLSLIHI